MKRKGMIIGGTILATIAGTYFGVGNYFYKYALKARKEKRFLEGNPNLELSEGIDPEIEAAAVEADREFQRVVPCLSKTIQSRDKLALKLEADYFPNNTAKNKWAVVVHGYSSKSSEMIRWIRGFHEQGFQVLSPNLRGHGRSEGDYIGMGWPDRLDLMTWLDALIEEHPDAEIVLFGLSMGASTVMMASGEDLPANVKVIVEDCGYSSVGKVFIHQLKDQFGLPPFPVMNAANTVIKMRAKYDINEASALNQVAKSKTPILFIHGDEDSFVPFSMLDELYNAATVEKEKLIIKGAEHGDAVLVDPERYWRTIEEFVSRFIK